MQKEICTPRHLVLAKVGNNQVVPVQLVSTRDTRRCDRMTVSGVTANNEDQVRLSHIGDRAGIATITNRAEQPHSCRRMAIARTIIDIVCTGYSSCQFLHEITFFVGAFRGRDKSDGVRTILGFQLRKLARHQTESFVPTGLAKPVFFADERSSKAVLTIDMPPAKLSLYAGRNAIRRTMLRRDLKDVTIFGPDVEAASHAAVRANRFGFAQAVLPQGRFRFRDLKNCSVARLGFNALDYLDHALERTLPHFSKKTTLT